MAERERIEEQKRERIAEQRLRGGSRFNLRYDDRVPAGMRPEDVMAALAEYVDFGGARPPARAGPAPAGDITMVRKGLVPRRSERLFGTPVSSSERREGGLAGHDPGLQRRRSADHRRFRRRRADPIHDNVSMMSRQMTRINVANSLQKRRFWSNIWGRTLGTGTRTGGFMKRLLSIAALLAMAAPGFAADSPKQVTFSKDVAPIFQAKCQECHQPNSIAPMSLITYQEARPWARSIKERVATRQMPPWHIDRTRRRAEVQERHVAQRRADRHHRRAGSTPARRRAIRRTCRRPSRSSPTTSGRRQRDGFGPPDLVDQVAGVHDAGRAPGRLVAADVATFRSPSRAG